MSEKQKQFTEMDTGWMSPLSAEADKREGGGTSHEAYMP